MSISVVQHVCSAQVTTNDATVAAAVTNVPTKGNYLIALGRHAGNLFLTSVADGVNIWTPRPSTGANAPISWIADCQVVGDMTGKTITATLGANDANKGIYVFEVASPEGLEFVTAAYNAVFFNGTARNFAGNKLPTKEVGWLQLGAWADSSQDTSLTPSAGWTNLPTATFSGGFSTASIFIEGVYKISVAADQSGAEPLATGATSPVGYSCIGALYKKSSPPSASHRMPLAV